MAAVFKTSGVEAFFNVFFVCLFAFVCSCPTVNRIEVSKTVAAMLIHMAKLRSTQQQATFIVNFDSRSVDCLHTKVCRLDVVSMLNSQFSRFMLLR